MANSVICRLAYLVVPRPELLQALGLEATTSEEVIRPVAVITAAHDYEETFEGWKRAWRTKAKQDFVSEFIATWSADFPAFTDQLQSPECFDQWWSTSEIDAFEIDPAWTPS